LWTASPHPIEITGGQIFGEAHLCSIHGGDLFQMMGREIEEIDLRRSCRLVEEANALLQDSPVAKSDVLIEDASFLTALNRHWPK
jgi:hypothetical protein